MRDIDIIMKAMLDAQALLGAYIEPGERGSRGRLAEHAGDT
jgi:hypothetical protein